MNKKKLLLPVLFLAIGVGGFAALKATRAKPPVVTPKEPVWRVEAFVAEPGRASPLATLNGRVESPDETRAAAPGVGRVLDVRVREGGAVAPGQLLLELDGRDFVPRVEQARAEVAELDAAIASEQLRYQSDRDQLEQERRLLDFAAAEVERFETLRRENFYSEAAVDQGRQNLARQRISVRARELAIADHRARLAQLQARRAKAVANLDQAELALARSRVIAPFAGFVAKVEVAVGDQVGAGQSLISLYPAAGLEVRAKLPATLQDEFIAAMRAGRHPDARAEIGGETLEFSMRRLAGTADARGLDAFFVARRPTTSLRVGELVTLRVARTPVDDAVPIPYTALFGGDRVYRIGTDPQGDARITAVPVEVLGEAVGGRLLVRAAALKAGDALVATHLPNAVSGLKVEVVK